MQIIVTNPVWLFLVLFLLVVIVAVPLVFVKSIMRYIVNVVTDDMISKLLSDKYTQNLAEFLPSLKRFSVLNSIELSLRAEEGKIITRPLGSPKHCLGFENLMFTPRQMTTLSLPESAEVDVSVRLLLMLKSRCS